MKQNRQYLAFDLGASSGRAILGFVRNGRLELEEIHRFKNYPYEKAGHYFWDFRALLGELETGLKKAVADVPDLASFSIDTWGVDYALFRGGELLHGVAAVQQRVGLGVDLGDGGLVGDDPRQSLPDLVLLGHVTPSCWAARHGRV